MRLENVFKNVLNSVHNLVANA